jgi:hypothetical protein
MRISTVKYGIISTNICRVQNPDPCFSRIIKRLPSYLCIKVFLTKLRIGLEMRIKIASVTLQPYVPNFVTVMAPNLISNCMEYILCIDLARSLLGPR